MFDSTKLHIALASCFPAVALSGCIFEYPEPCPVGKVEINIVNDWRFSPEADPEGMAYLFYLDGEGKPWRFDFPGRKAGNVAMDEGDYEFVMYNDDTSHVIFETSSAGIPVATTEESSLEIEGMEQSVRKSPDLMWGYGLRKVEISSNEVAYSFVMPDGSIQEERNEDMTIHTYPRQLTPLYHVKVLGVDNWSGVSSCTGILTGMADSLELTGDISATGDAAINFNLAMQPDSVLSGKFYNFGPGKEQLPSEERNELRLYFRLSDGRVVCKVYDKTEEIEKAEDPMDVTLVIDRIDLPYAPPATGGGPFDALVAPWREIEITYET